MRHFPRFGLLAATTLLAVGCSTRDAERIAGPGDLGHIHDLTQTSDGTLLVASHSGLYRIDDTETAVLIGSEQHDLMSMTAADGSLYSSGHPDLRLEQYRVEGHPPHLGLAESRDLGATWTVDPDLLGKHDFHALLPTSRGLLAADTEGVISLRRPDGTWTDLGNLSARDLAADPNNPDLVVATDDEANLWHSSDGGQTWTIPTNTPDAIEVEWAASDRLIAATEDGAIWSASDPTGQWAKTATAPSDVETLHIDGDQWWVTGHGGTIHASVDDGQSWTPVYLPQGSG